MMANEVSGVFHFVCVRVPLLVTPSRVGRFFLNR